MTLEVWAFFCVTETLLCLNPGSSALLVISLGMTRGQAAGVAATAGVLAANAIYFALSATGLAAVHSLSLEAFRAIKWLGAAYLIWLAPGGVGVTSGQWTIGPGKRRADGLPGRHQNNGPDLTVSGRRAGLKPRCGYARAAGFGGG